MAIHKTFGKGYTDKPNDDVRTPTGIVQDIISRLDIYKGQFVLDAFAGDKVFYDNYLDYVEKDWCEIKEGKDFFEYTQKVDWIVTNPPYSIFKEILEHSFKIADNVAYLVPLSKVVSSMGRIRMIKEYGGVPYIYILSASKCKFPFGFPVCLIHIKKGYDGDTQIEVDE